jgi:hypothetical protein
MPCSIYLEYRNSVKMSTLTNTVGGVLQCLLGLSYSPTIGASSLKGYDSQLASPIRGPMPEFVDGGRLLILEADQGGTVFVRYTEAFFLHDAGPLVPTVFVDLPAASGESDIAVGAATCAAMARLLGTEILDPEGCYRGPKKETEASFVSRLSLGLPQWDYDAAVKILARKLGRLGDE